MKQKEEHAAELCNQKRLHNLDDTKVKVGTAVAPNTRGPQSVFKCTLIKVPESKYMLHNFQSLNFCQKSLMVGID